MYSYKNNTSNLLVSRLLGTLVLCVISVQANAALVTLNFQFDINVLDAGDAFVTTYGLSDGDFILAESTHDDSLVTGSGYEQIWLGDVDHSFTLNIGSLTLSETDDVDFGFDLPSINFLDGDWVGFAFLADVDVGGVIYEVSLEQDFFEITNLTSSALVVNNASPIPVPAALPLMASGLLALFGIRRRSKRLASK